MSKTQELRDAFVAGARVRQERVAPAGLYFNSNWQEEAKEAYPSPTVIRPREIKIGLTSYRVVEGRAEVWSGGAWVRSDTYKDLLSPGRTITGVRAILDLIENPTETAKVEE